MKLRTSEYFIQEVFRSLRRNNWMTFASVGTVTVSLFVLGVFLILALNMNRLAGILESEVQISVYLEDSVTDAPALADELKAVEGVETAVFVPREEARERLKERLADQSYLLDALGETNPLPNAYDVTVKDPSMVVDVAAKLAEIKGVEEAKYGQDVVKHLFDLTRLMRVLGALLIVMLAGATLFIISNTIRLTVFARRKEIAIMKYVGATDWFIRWPFLLEGIVMGGFGGLLAALALRSFYAGVAAKVYSTLAFFPLMPEFPFVNYLTAGIIAAGMAIGALGSGLSLKRFLKV